VLHRPDRVTHVVQAVEEADEVVILARVVLRARFGELRVPGDALGLGDLLRPLDRRVVVVEPVDRGLRIRLRHQDRRDPVPAADVGHLGAGAELVLGLLERGDPLIDQVRPVAGAEELLGADEQVGVVFVPAESLTLPEPLRELRPVLVGRADDAVPAKHEYRAVGIGERHRLLGRQCERVRLRVIGQVAARGLGRSPFAHVALRHAGLLRDLGSGQRAGAPQGLPEAKLAADHHQHPVHRSAHVGHGLAHELLELLLVDGRRGGLHRVSSPGAASSSPPRA
jgi:hypothetical protein